MGEKGGSEKKWISDSDSPTPIYYIGGFSEVSDEVEKNYRPGPHSNFGGPFWEEGVIEEKTNGRLEIPDPIY